MRQPRPIVASAPSLLPRRALRRHLLLRPEGAIPPLVLSTLPVSARRDGLRVHARCLLFSPLHRGVTDVEGLLPRFVQFFPRLVALGPQVLRTWEGPGWDPEPTRGVRLRTPAAVVEQSADGLANPVAAGLVEQAHEWPGAKVRVDELGGGVLRTKRPEESFHRTHPQGPEQATLERTLPPGVGQDAAAGFRQKVGAELARQQGQAGVAALACWRRHASFDTTSVAAVGRGNATKLLAGAGSDPGRSPWGQPESARRRNPVRSLQSGRPQPQSAPGQPQSGRCAHQAPALAAGRRAHGAGGDAPDPGEVPGGLTARVSVALSQQTAAGMRTGFFDQSKAPSSS